MPTMELSTTFDFASSHFLENYKGKCENLHGHNYKMTITIEGEVKKDGMIKDFKEIKKIVQKYILEKIDHKHLNEIIDNPSVENLIVWIWKNLKTHLPELKRIKIYETDTCYCTYEGK